jgi:hypothetical protein
LYELGSVGTRSSPQERSFALPSSNPIIIGDARVAIRWTVLCSDYNLTLQQPTEQQQIENWVLPITPHRSLEFHIVLTSVRAGPAKQMLPNLTTGRILGKLQANLRTKASSLFTALPAEVAVPSTRQKQFILQTLDIHQQPNYKPTRLGEVFSPLFFSSALPFHKHKSKLRQMYNEDG